MAALTVKQEKFCLAYIETGNASEAYRTAYNAGRMKSETVNRAAFDIMQNPNISARVAELRARASEKACISEARVLEEAARIGLFDPSDMFDVDGKLLPIHKISPKARAAIASIEVEEIRTDGEEITVRVKKVKLWDKNSAIEKLMKHMGMFEKDNSQKLPHYEEMLRLIIGTGSN